MLTVEKRKKEVNEFIMEKLYGRTIGERIRLLRESAGIRQEDLARDFKLANAGVVSFYENDRRALPTDIVVAYSKKFEVSTDWILKGNAG